MTPSNPLHVFLNTSHTVLSRDGHLITKAIAIITFVIAGTARPANALPFHKNCASMQAYYNAKYTQQAADFEKRVFQEGVGAYTSHCRGGIIVNKTSAGTEVCTADLDWMPVSRLITSTVYTCYMR